MPRIIEDDLVSESEFENVPLEQAINDSFKDLQAGLNELQVALFAIIDHDVIDHEHYGLCYESAVSFVELSKELLSIVKSFKPTGFKPNKLTSTNIADASLNY